MSMALEWDDVKNCINIEKYQLDCQDAKEVLSNGHLLRQDTRHAYGENRYIAIGMLQYKMVIVVYTRHAKSGTALFQWGEPMKEKGNVSKTNSNALKTLGDDTIDYSDIPELDDDFFKEAVYVPPRKQSLNVRYDYEVIDYFKNHVGKGYQTLMNAVLKKYVRAQKANTSSDKDCH